MSDNDPSLGKIKNKSNNKGQKQEFLPFLAEIVGVITYTDTMTFRAISMSSTLREYAPELKKGAYISPSQNARAARQLIASKVSEQTFLINFSHRGI